MRGEAMTRVRTVRVITCHASLACAHHVHLRLHGFYPAAAVCPVCPVPHAAWITALAVVGDDHALIGNDVPPPAPHAEPADQPPTPEPQIWQTYTVGVHTDRRHESYDGPDEYVLNAPNLTEAVVLAARAAVADAEQDAEALVTIDDDGLPTIHVVWIRTGMPTHPSDTPGLAWADLRHDTPIPAKPPQTAG